MKNGSSHPVPKDETTRPNAERDVAGELRLDEAEIGGSPMNVVIFVDDLVLSFTDRPRRFTDVSVFPEKLQSEVITLRTFATDEDLEKSRYDRKAAPIREILLTTSLILKNLHVLRAATHVYCRSTVAYFVLLHLSRVPLLLGEKEKIYRTIFRMAGLRRVLGRMRSAPAAFSTHFIDQSQVAEARSLVGDSSRISFLNWRIDTDWYHPKNCEDRPDWYVVPGNAHRDEEVVDALVREGFNIIRVGRSEELMRRFEAYSDTTNFRIEVNLTHIDYRHLIQSAKAILLPIKECDEPAGLTACLEAIACEVPLLISKSIGVTDIVEAIKDLEPPVASDSPAHWVDRVRKFEDSGGNNVEGLKNGRRYVQENHSLGRRRRQRVV